MTYHLQFRIQFMSDWHVSYDTGAIADAVIERDADGVPIIAGSTLKGLFRDALVELTQIDYLQADISWIAHLLGNPQQEGTWRFGQARPESVPFNERSAETGVDYAYIATGVRVDPKTRRAEDSKFYQREMGTSTLDFTFEVERTGDTVIGDIQLEVEWLVAAARLIRRLGNRRRRGTGSCQIYLIDQQLQQRLLTSFFQRLDGKSSVIAIPNAQSSFEYNEDKPRRVRIILRTDEPVVIASRPEAGNNFAGQLIIPGQTLRGSMAWKVDRQKRDSESFKGLFVLGALRFTNLLPLEVEPKTWLASAIDEVPLGLVAKDKNPATRQSIFIDSNLLGYKSYKDKFHVFKADIPPAKLNRDMHMHVAIDPYLKRAKEHDLYSYEAIPRRRYYVGEMELTRNGDWHEIEALISVPLRQAFSMIIGKGRGRGYGKCSIWLEPVDEAAPPSAMPLSIHQRVSARTQEVILTLASDAILLDTFGRAIRQFDATWLSEELGVGVASIERQSVATRLIESFDLRSGLPRWRDLALAKGSSVKLRLAQTLDVNELETLEKRGIGLRQAEGYGRVIFNHPLHSGQAFTFERITIPEALRPEKGSMTKSSFERRFQKQLDQVFEDRRFEGEQYQTLARWLLENVNLPLVALLDQLAVLGKADELEIFNEKYRQQRVDKQNRLNPQVHKGEVANFEFLTHLLKWLEDYPTYRQRGREMLAEKIYQTARSKRDA